MVPSLLLLLLALHGIAAAAVIAAASRTSTGAVPDRRALIKATATPVVVNTRYLFVRTRYVIHLICCSFTKILGYAAAAII